MQSLPVRLRIALKKSIVTDSFSGAINLFYSKVTKRRLPLYSNIDTLMHDP